MSKPTGTLPVFSLAALVLCGALATTFAGGSDAPPAESPAPAIAFVDVNVIAMEPGTALMPRQTVLVEGDRIVQVGPSHLVQLPADARRIDGRGHYLLPGLADMHVHLEHFQDPAVLDWFVGNGVTTVRNMDGRPHILQWRRAVAGGERRGPRIYSAGPILDGEPPMQDGAVPVADAAHAREVVATQAREGYDFIKVYTGLGEDAYFAALEAASAHGMKVAGHAPRSVEMEQVLSSRLASLEHLTDLGDLVESDDSPFRGRWHWSRLGLGMPADPARMADAARRVAEAGLWVVPTLVQAERAIVQPAEASRWCASEVYLRLPAGACDYWLEQNAATVARLDEDDWALVRRGRANRLALVGELGRQGARILAGTDTPSAFVPPGYSVADELALLVEAGLEPGQALAAATIDAARFMDATAEWGSIREGKVADMLLLAANPLQDIEAVRQPVGVMVRGQWLPKASLARLAAEARLDREPADARR